MTDRTIVRQMLDIANGKRRTRLLEFSDIKDAAENLKDGEHVFLHGGHVANAYKYPSHATGAVVWRQGVWICAQIRKVNGSKGSTGFGRFDQWKPPEITEESEEGFYSQVGMIADEKVTDGKPDLDILWLDSEQISSIQDFSIAFCQIPLEKAEEIVGIMVAHEIQPFLAIKRSDWMAACQVIQSFSDEPFDKDASKTFQEMLRSLQVGMHTIDAM